MTLVDDRVVTGDFQCLDKQGNLILGNAAEIIAHHHHHGGGDGGGGDGSGSSDDSSAAGSSGKAAGGGAGGAGGAAPSQPMERALGTVLVPAAQQKDVQLLVTLSERAAMLELAAGS